MEKKKKSHQLCCFFWHLNLHQEMSSGICIESFSLALQWAYAIFKNWAYMKLIVCKLQKHLPVLWGPLLAVVEPLTPGILETVSGGLSLFAKFWAIAAQLSTPGLGGGNPGSPGWEQRVWGPYVKSKDFLPSFPHPPSDFWVLSSLISICGVQIIAVIAVHKNKTWLIGISFTSTLKILTGFWCSA